MSVDLTPATARAHAMAAAVSVGDNLLLNELIYFLPSATVYEFMEDFNRHLDAGDFADLINS